jgi:hypothetical protein
VYIGFIPIMFCHTIKPVYRDTKVCFDVVDLIGSTRKEINQGDLQHENLFLGFEPPAFIRDLALGVITLCGHWEICRHLLTTLLILLMQLE